MRRIVFGALAGLCATMAMTAAMRRLHQRLPDDLQYPLPPRELTERSMPQLPLRTLPGMTIVNHFAYGALTGAIYAYLPKAYVPGIVYGPMVWTASYLGWVPMFGLLEPATKHPRARNSLMLLAHVIWGAALSSSLHELHAAERSSFARGPLGDVNPNEARPDHDR